MREWSVELPRWGAYEDFFDPGLFAYRPWWIDCQSILGRPIEGRNPGDAITVTMTNGYGSQLTRRVMRVDEFRGCNLCLPVQAPDTMLVEVALLFKNRQFANERELASVRMRGRRYPLFTDTDPRVPVRLLLGPRQTVVAPRISWSPASREARCRRCASWSGAGRSLRPSPSWPWGPRRDGLRPGAAHRCARKRAPGCSCCSRFLPRRKRTRSCSGSRMRRRSS